jgi:uncharacterized protein (DUF983 family)
MAEQHGVLGRLWAVVCQRCPRCLRGQAFKSFLEMHERCPECGMLFQREEGYFLGAMYVSYALGGVLVAIAWFSATAIWPDVHPYRMCLYIFAAYVPLMPFLYRYARIIWMHFDWVFCPGDSAASPYQKAQRPRT